MSEREARLMAQLAELQAKHDALVKRLREPTQEMFDALTDRMWKDHTSSTVWKAMSAVALDKEGK